jgi:hypothetical protein
LIIEADPASIVDLPAGGSVADGGDTGTAGASGRLGGASRTPTAASAQVPDAIRRASSGGGLPLAALALAALLGLVLIGVAGLLTLAKYRRWPGVLAAVRLGSRGRKSGPDPSR